MYNSYFRDNMIAQSIVSFVRGDVNGDGIPRNPLQKFRGFYE